MRLTKAKISRGAFNRTLRQAKENVTKSIYTVILLGYLGVFESTTLDPYIEIANQLHTYLDAYKNALSEDTSMSERLKIIGLLRQQLETSLQQAFRPFDKADVTSHVTQENTALRSCNHKSFAGDRRVPQIWRRTQNGPLSKQVFVSRQIAPSNLNA